MANQPLLDLIAGFANQKGASPAQISLAWMLHKKDFIVPIPGARKPERIQVLLDVMIPKMDGLELYNQLKKADPDIKVCFLTASSETYHEELGKERHYELNKDLFLHMPLPIKEIIEEIRKRIDSSWP